MQVNLNIREQPSRRSNIIYYFLTSGSPRVFNSLRIGEEILRDAGESQPGLFFRTSILNKSVLFKDLRVIPNSFGGTVSTRVGTKVYIPFDSNRLGDGGRSFFYDRRNFMQVISELVDLRDGRHREDAAADSDMLELMDSLPTFAPFLLRDRFEQAQVTINPKYVDIPQSEWDDIRSFIRSRFQEILTAVSGKGTAVAGGALERLLDKLWELNDVPALQELASAFGIPREGCLEYFYAWKGMLYFTWVFEALQKAIFEMGSWLQQWPSLVLAYPPHLRAASKDRFKALHEQIFRELRRIENILAEYDRAFGDLFVRAIGPERFIKFLTSAPSYFSVCGIGTGTLQHAHEVWDRLTESFPDRQASYQVLDEVLNAVSGVLAQAA